MADFRISEPLRMPKVAAIVGIGPGLGASLARKFSKEGYHVALLARNAEHLKPVEEEIANFGGKSISIVSDACDVDSVSKAFDTVIVYYLKHTHSLDSGKTWRFRCIHL